MFQSCKSCPSFNKGKGSKRCLTACDEYAKLFKYERSHFSYLSLPSEVVENIVASVPVAFLELVCKLDEEQGTMLCQSIFLRMSHKEVMGYHQKERKYSRSKVTRMIATGVSNLRKLIRDTI